MVGQHDEGFAVMVCLWAVWASCSGLQWWWSLGFILESFFGKHSGSISVETQPVIHVPDGGVVCQVDVGEGGAVLGDLHINVMYDTRWGVCTGQEGGDHNPAGSLCHLSDCLDCVSAQGLQICVDNDDLGIAKGVSL